MIYLINAWTQNPAKNNKILPAFLKSCISVVPFAIRLEATLRQEGLIGTQIGGQLMEVLNPSVDPSWFPLLVSEPQVWYMTRFNPAKQFITDVQLIPILAQVPRSNLLDYKMPVGKGTWKTWKSQVIRTILSDIDSTCVVLFASFA